MTASGGKRGEAARIVGLAVAAAIAYGVLHDQVTARLRVEYFTIGHPPIFATESPTLLALGWGVLATWWVGLLLGLLLAFAALRGPRPIRTARSLRHPIAILLGVMACGSLLAGGIGWFLATSGWVHLLEPLASRVPPERHVPFVADLWAHRPATCSASSAGSRWSVARGARGVRRSAPLAAPRRRPSVAAML